MNESVKTVIDPEKCIGCGDCVRVCPSGTISMNGEKAEVTGTKSLQCGHCQAICPVDAVRVTALKNDEISFATFSATDKWLPYGAFDKDLLARLMRSRRSCRCYRPVSVPREVMADLIRFGVTAPSGTNSQACTFSVLPTRKDVVAFGEIIGDFFRRLNRNAERGWLRTLLKGLGNPSLDNYFHNHYPSVRDALRRYDDYGVDLLFHGAPSVIIVTAKPEASCPGDDALLISQNILLAAHAMGLGTCLIGYAVKAMCTDGSIKRHLRIPASETVHAVIALGYPDVEYRRLTGRRMPEIRYTTVV